MKIGDRVIYRPSFGSGHPIIGTITGFGFHKGQRVIDFSNSSWAYEHQIDSIHEEAS